MSGPPFCPTRTPTSPEVVASSPAGRGLCEDLRGREERRPNPSTDGGSWGTGQLGRARPLHPAWPRAGGHPGPEGALPDSSQLRGSQIGTEAVLSSGAALRTHLTCV